MLAAMLLDRRVYQDLARIDQNILYQSFADRPWTRGRKDGMLLIPQ